MPKAKWKTAQARAAMLDIAQDIATAFAIPAPAVMRPDYRTGRDWEWRIECMEVWTKAGRAELSIRVDADFAHLYFRFDDPARAAEFDTATGRLNRFSGKWNRIGTPDDWARNGKPDPQDSIDMFRAELRRDFRKVAEKNPPADEIAAYRAKEDAQRAQWAALAEDVNKGA